MHNEAIDTPAFLEPLCLAMAAHNRCLLVAQPGAGKTTRAPLALLDDAACGSGRWLLLEPRRVAARLAAGYMAGQRGEQPGQRIGYRVRGEQRIGPATRLEVITQGIFTRMLQDDPLLDGISGVIFDEFHERSLEADLGLALTLDVQQSLRPDLKLLMMSATLDVAALQTVLGPDTPLIEHPGRQWPVSTHYRSSGLREEPEQLQDRVIREALAAQDGDLLVFLPGQREIRRLQQRLQDSLSPDMDIRPLHGQLPLTEQRAVLRPAADGRRRIILSTAIAESSLTVPGVRIVIDAGRERVPVYQPRSGMTRLATRQVNRASADQRRGRAGREAPGHCYRLWPEDAVLQPHREPEILQADLAALVLELIRWGVTDPGELQWINPPPAAALASASTLLQQLGILEQRGGLTAFGQRCADWPTHPRLAALLETAREQRALPLACWLVAWLEESPSTQETDIARIIESVAGSGSTDRRWQQAARQWAARSGCRAEPVDLTGIDSLLAHAYPDRIAANLGGGRFRLATGGQAVLPETHPLCRSDWLIAVSLDGQASGARIFHAVATRRETLEQAFPACRQWHSHVRWDDGAGRLLAEEVRSLGSIVLDRRPLRALPPGVAVDALIDALRRRGTLNWSDADRQTLGRLRLLHRTLGDPWPDVGEQRLLDSLEQWLAPYLEGMTRLEQVDRLPLGRHLLEGLDWTLQTQLDQLAPTHVQVPSGARLRLDYTGDEPILAVKLQEMFGQTDTPRVAGGAVPVVLHLLSPARRPVQVTRDLASFWSGAYFDVRKDLKGRYPKHPWPDDPLTATATHRTNRAK